MSRTEIEVLLRRAILLYLGVQQNWDNTKIAKAMRKGVHPAKVVDDMFVGRTPQQVINDLYTSDLKTIVTANRDVFQHLFAANRGRFEMNMETLNKARRVDAPMESSSPADRARRRLLPATLSR